MGEWSSYKILHIKFKKKKYKVLSLFNFYLYVLANAFRNNIFIKNKSISHC